MRPTWHLVAAEDIRWMLKLSAQRIISANDSFAKGYDLDIPNELYTKAHDLLEKILCGKKSLTKQEIAEHFNRSGKASFVVARTEEANARTHFWKNGFRRCPN